MQPGQARARLQARLLRSQILADFPHVTVRLNIERCPHITFTGALGEMGLSTRRVHVPDTLEARRVSHPLALAAEVGVDVSPEQCREAVAA